MKSLGLPNDTSSPLSGRNLVSASCMGFLGSRNVISSISHSSSIRYSAQWYPEVQDNTLFLNEESFVGAHMSSQRDLPLRSLHFGGPKGVDLCKIVALSAWIINKERLMGIEFAYD